jgi:hypothetical protein
MAGAKPMSSNGEWVPNDVVNREEPLGLCHRAVLVDGPPEVLTLAADCHEEFVRCHVSPTGPARRRSRRA